MKLEDREGVGKVAGIKAENEVMVQDEEGVVVACVTVAWVLQGPSIQA